MKVLSVNVGLPRTVEWKGKPVTTGIFKQPVAGRVALKALDFDGDGQADLSVHGGPNKAVYVYPAEHYADWRRELPDQALPWGMFGENLTVWGLRDDTVHIGDHLQVGSARLVVRSPRMPCYKLGMKFGRDNVLKLLFENGLSGFYCAVLQEGNVAAGDPVTLLYRDESAVTVRDIVHLQGESRYDADLLRRAVAVEALPQSWRETFLERLEQFS